MLILTVNEWVGPGKKCTPEQYDKMQVVQGVAGMATRLPLADAIRKLNAHKKWFDSQGLTAVCYTLLGVCEVDDLDDDLIISMQMILIENMQTDGDAITECVTSEGQVISRAEALRFAGEILEQAERERLITAEHEADRGIQWEDNDTRPEV